MGTDFFARMRAFLSSCWMAAASDAFREPLSADEWTAKFTPVHDALMASYVEIPPDMDKIARLSNESTELCKQMREDGFVPSMAQTADGGMVVVNCVPTPVGMSSLS